MHVGGHRHILVSLLCLGAVVAGCGDDSRDGDAAAGRDLELEHNATVLDVVDGDTLVVDIDGREETVRLIGIDTPETVAPDRPVECYGPEASERLAALMPRGTPVRLARDIEPRDVYDRLLAYVFRAEDGLHINLDQVRQGYAEAMSYPPNTTLTPDFTAAERAARGGRLGLWTACPGQQRR